MRACSSCSFYSVDVYLRKVQALPLALCLSQVKWDHFSVLAAFSLSALVFHPDDTMGTLKLSRAFLVAPGTAEADAQSGPGAHMLLAVVGSIPAPWGWAPQ